MACNLVASIAIGIMKLIVYTFDFITLPAYFIIQCPWNKWKSEKDIWGGPMFPEDPSSPIVRKKFVVKVTENIFQPAQTIISLFKTCVEKYQDRQCFGTREILSVEEEVQADGQKMIKKSLGGYKWLTFKEADKKIEKLGTGFLAIGIKPKDHILIFAETRMEWMLSALAIFHAAGTDEAIVYGINECQVSVIVTSQELLPRLRKLIDQTPKVKTIICMETFGPFSLKDFPDDVMVITLSQFEKLGTTVRDVTYINLTPDDIAFIMYTSGSTGIPKGVMLTHSNILAMGSELYLTYGDHIFTGRPYVGYLPLSHIMGLTIELYAVGCGVPNAFSSPATLTDNSIAIKPGEKGDISLIEPGMILAVPIMLDRIRKTVCETASKKGAFAEKLFNFSMNRNAYWRRLGFQTKVLESIIFRKVRCLFGKNMKHILTGGAALAPDTQQFCRTCLGVKVFQGYGLTETAGTGTLMHYDDEGIGFVGPPGPGVYIRLRDWEEGGYCSADKPNPRGELIIGGTGIARAYLNQEELTQESFFEENGIKWFYTGDIGEIYPNGSIKMIDRKKGLIKLLHGEYVSLSKVETELKTCPLIENICALGDLYSTFTIALIVPNRVMLADLAKRMGKSHHNFMELCDDPIIIEEVTNKVKEYAIKCNLQKTEIPQKIKLCKEQWTPDNNLLTATFKLRRHCIRQVYDKDVRQLYREGKRSLRTY